MNQEAHNGGDCYSVAGCMLYTFRRFQYRRSRVLLPIAYLSFPFYAGNIFWGIRIQLEFSFLLLCLHCFLGELMFVVASDV